MPWTWTCLSRLFSRGHSTNRVKRLGDMCQTEHTIFRHAFRRFVEKEVIPGMGHWEEQGIIPREAWHKMGNSGFLCPWLPEECGGSGADFLYSVIIAEELAKSGAVSLLAPLHSDIVVPYIYHLWTAEQRSRWRVRMDRSF